MLQVVKFYLKILILFGVSFAVLMYLIGVVFGDPVSFTRFLSFSIVMSMVLVTMHLIVLKYDGVKVFTYENLGVIHKRKISSTLSKQDFVEQLTTSREFKNMNLVNQEDEIRLSAGWSWRSFGENIRIDIRELPGKLNEFEIASRPCVRTTLIDYGKNLKNVNAIEKLITGLS